MIVKWLGKVVTLDILTVFSVYGYFYCLFCSIIHRQMKRDSHQGVGVR